jgi:hypothetical protein
MDGMAYVTVSCREPVLGPSEPTEVSLGDSQMLELGVRKVVVGGAPPALMNAAWPL